MKKKKDNVTLMHSLDLDHNREKICVKSETQQVNKVSEIAT